MKRDGRVNSGLQKPLEDGGSFPWEARKRGKPTLTPVNTLQSLAHNLGIITTNFDTELHPQ